MSRRRGRNVHGVVLLDKPLGVSSNKALQQVRRLFDARKAGHTGSLDPLATGMLPICLGEASKTAGFMLDAEKRYVASLRLGSVTATGDAEGEVLQHCSVPELEVKEIEAALDSFLGEIKQVPPMYSALKVDGKPLYKLARQGQVVERKARAVQIYSLRLLEWSSPEMHFEVQCSKGTYIRTLGEDIAGALGSCGHLVALRRRGVGAFDSSLMVTLEELQSLAEEEKLGQCLLPIDAGLAHWPKITLEEPLASRFGHGNPVPTEHNRPGQVRVYSVTRGLLGLGQVGPDGQLKPNRVFVLN